MCPDEHTDGTRGRVSTGTFSVGPAGEFDRLFALFYDELRDIAHRHLRREREGHTLVTTALVHEAYLKLSDRPEFEWGESVRFRAFVSRAMRHVLVDHARGRGAQKRGGDAIHVTLQTGGGWGAEEPPALALVDLDEALTTLAGHDPRLERVVECRFFGDLSIQETAEALGISTSTVERDWTRAKAYLHQLLRSERG